MLSNLANKNNGNVISDIEELKLNLVEISLNSLEELYIPEKKLFYARRKIIDGKVINKGESIRYTIIALLGLYKIKEHGVKISIDINEVLLNLLDNLHKFKNIGDVGLLLWICSLESPDKLINILAKINFKNIFNIYPDAKKRRTTELAWFLIGLLSATIFNKNFASVIGDLPQKVYQELRNNYGGSGIFSHQASKILTLPSRTRIGTFSDQIYSIYAFTMYSKVFNNEEASIIALNCTETLCREQGQNGEWWWHYDSTTGKTIGKYPIYTVHQDSLAPLAFKFVKLATRKSFDKYTQKGLRWLLKENSPIQPVIDENNLIITRCVSISKFKRYFNTVLALLNINRNDSEDDLSRLNETWTFHYGWILYSYSDLLNSKNDENSESTDETTNLKIFNI